MSLCTKGSTSDAYSVEQAVSPEKSCMSRIKDMMLEHHRGKSESHPSEIID